MADWRTMLRADPTDWLLEETDPAVRVFALCDLLALPAADARVTDAREAAMRSGMIPRILSLQAEESYAKQASRFYTAKYGGLVWTLIVLAELGATPNPQIRAQCEYLLENAQERTEGGFSQQTAVRTGGGRMSEVIPCLTGNMVWSLLRLGFDDDPRVWRGVDWLVRNMCYNDGEELQPQREPYRRLEICWGAHTCLMGVVKALKAYGAIPVQRRTAEINAAIEEAAAIMLKHHVFKRSHDTRRVSKPGWRRFGFPLMYQTDALEILDCLTTLGYRDPRMAEAVALVQSKQDAQGRWHVENTYNSDRLLVPFEAAGQPSKWITLRAMRVLKRYAQG